MQSLAHVNVLFDLDGTFIDTAGDLTAALNYTIESEEIPPFDVETAKFFVGKGIAVMLERAFAKVNRQLDPDKKKVLFDKLLNHYLSNIAVHSRPFPGAVEVAEALRAKGAKVGICTNKLMGPTLLLLDALELRSLFDVVTGGDSFEVKKPDPRHLINTYAMMGSSQVQVMVGDTVNDFAAAKGAKALAVGVRFGYGSKDDLSEADILIDSFAELHEIVNKTA